MNKEQIKLQIKKIEDEIDFLSSEFTLINNSFEKERSKYYKKLSSLERKVEKFHDKLYEIEKKEHEEKFSKKDIDAAKNLLQECGYAIVRL